MYDSEYDESQNWPNAIWTMFSKEVIKRIYESATVAQWIEVAEMNRSGDDEHRQVPEKEFLLTWAASVSTNPKGIDVGKNHGVPTCITGWIGKEYIVKLDRFYHRPRLRIRHAAWSDISPRGDGHEPPPPPGPGPWSRPLSAGFYSRLRSSSRSIGRWIVLA